jgi:hypothetical protein
VTDNSERQSLIDRALAANADELLPTDVFGPLLLSVLKEQGMSQDALVKRLREHGREVTPSTLSKLIKGKIKSLSALILQIALQRDEQESKPPLRIGVAKFPDYAFLQAVARQPDGSEGPMGEFTKFIEYDVSKLLDVLLGGEIHLTLMSQWRIECLPLEQQSKVRYLAGKNPVLRVRNNQMCVVGKNLQKTEPYEKFYMEACRIKRFERRDRIGYALSRTLAQIVGERDIDDSLHVVSGSWLRAFHTMVNLARRWLATKEGLVHDRTREQIKSLWTWVDKQRQKNKATAHTEELECRASAAHDRIQKEAKSNGPFFFVGNLATMLIAEEMLLAEENYPVPVILSNNALLEITDLGHLIPGENQLSVGDVFFPRHHIISTYGLPEGYLHQEIFKLKKRWNALIPNLAAGSTDLVEIGKAVDSVLSGSPVWQGEKCLFQQMIARRCFEFYAWL